MLLQFKKMVQFSLLVKAGGRLREFNFRKLRNTEEEALFTVNVCDEKDDRVFFTMTKNEKDWAIPQQLPAWLSQSQKDLKKALEEELQKVEWA